MRIPAGRDRGFTLVELLMVAALTMVLLFGAIYSASESFAVVSEGDARAHTHVHARRALDRLLKDCRYAAAVDVAGDADTGWTITIDATSSLDPDVLVYTWDPQTAVLRVSDGLLSPDIAVEGLETFDLGREFADHGAGPVIARIKFDWVLLVDAGDESGSTVSGRTLSLSGATWVRVNA
ncbi:MAG: prepilin-type N-terminal cleavage/methylation domain-containing protein [Planctomycetes bacterium]|nr:prepilin-type N-terminal cleavage/methylation domain-containing protein [Planctomycetota bacterium]